jgi:hypothetical protein
MDKAKLLKLMRFWLFGTFIIIFATATVYTGGVLKVGLEILKTWQYWVAMLIAAALSVGSFYLYKWWLEKK